MGLVFDGGKWVLGPDASGSNLSSVGYVEVDLTNPDYTLYDPDTLVKSNTFSGGFNNVVMNALAVGNTDYAWGSPGDTDQRAPRWYIPLEVEDASGNTVRITTGDTFILQVLIQKGTTTSEFNTEVICATAVTGTGLNAFDNDAQGAIMEYIAAGNTGYGHFGFSSKTVTTEAANDRASTVSLHAGARGQGGTFITLDGSGAALNGGSRNASMDYSADNIDMFLIVGVGTRGASTINDGDDTDFKIGYRVVKFN